MSMLCHPHDPCAQFDNALCVLPCLASLPVGWWCCAPRWGWWGCAPAAGWWWCAIGCAAPSRGVGVPATTPWCAGLPAGTQKPHFLSARPNSAAHEYTVSTRRSTTTCTTASCLRCCSFQKPKKTKNPNFVVSMRLCCLCAYPRPAPLLKGSGLGTAPAGKFEGPYLRMLPSSRW